MPTPLAVVHDYPIGRALTVSFQRYAAPTTGVVRALPASLGALPVALIGGSALLAAPDGEAYWIGLVPVPDADPTSVGAIVTLRSGERFDLITGAAPADRPHGIAGTWHAIVGIPRGDGSWLALGGTRPVRALEFHTGRGAEPAGRVMVLGARAFTALTGHRVAPLDESSGYGGWRLP